MQLALFRADVTPTERSDLITELESLLPRVTAFLKERDQLDDWTSFMRQLSEGTFPTNNLAYKLFLDVVKLHEQGSIYAMRYSPTVKQFWAVGYRLFKSTFIRFMGGLKCQGQTGAHI